MSIWLTLLLCYVVPIPVVFILAWVMDQAYMAKKSWGCRVTQGEAFGSAVGWPFLLVLAIVFHIKDWYEKLWLKPILFRPKGDRSKCKSKHPFRQQGIHSDEV